MSIAHSTYTLDATAAAVSPSESNIDPLSENPESTGTPAISPRGPTSNPLSRTTSNVTFTLAGPAPGKRQQVYWPRDLLPSDIPNAMIFTYGYDADVVKKPFTKGSEANTDAGAEEISGLKGKLNFTQHAHDLLVTLNRKLPNNASVILCAHSLGGVLAKRVSKQGGAAFNDTMNSVRLVAHRFRYFDIRLTSADVTS